MVRSCNSVGRVPPLQGGGRWFESSRDHHISSLCFYFAFFFFISLQAITQPIALVLQNDALVPLGNLREVLEAHGFQIKVLEAFEHPYIEMDPLEPDLVISLGGRSAAYDGSTQMEEQTRFLRTRLEADKPTIGICLGAQLMASALGATVYAGPEFEVGWKNIIFDDAQQDSLLANVLAGKAKIYASHGDTFDLPEGAQHIAKTADYLNHAFEWKNNGIALQFHPEVNESIIRGWFTIYGPRVTDAQKRAIAEENTTAIEQQKKAMRLFWDQWLTARF